MAALASLTGADQAASARSMSMTLDRYPEGLPSRPPPRYYRSWDGPARDRGGLQDQDRPMSGVGVRDRATPDQRDPVRPGGQLSSFN